MSKCLAAGVALVALFASTAMAQQSARCRGNEGRTWSGACVNPGLAASLRHRGVHATQVMINQWMYPVPPSADGTFPRGFDLNRWANVHGSGSTNPFPPSP